jgi:hypothetical protein
MAFLDPLARLDPPHRPDWRSELTTAQFGPMAEDLLAVSFAAAGGGRATVAYPMVDRGIDLYLRRLRTLLTFPIQVKAFGRLGPDGTASLDLLLDEVKNDPNGYLALVHAPAPHDQLYRRIYLIPEPVFHQRCPRGMSHGTEKSLLVVNFSGTATDLWSDYLLDIDRLPDWLASLPGWGRPVPPVPHPIRTKSAVRMDDPSHWVGNLGRLWVAGELERAGAGNIVLAEDRVRLDTVSLLIHDLRSSQFAGLHVRTGRITPGRTVHFEVMRPTFFIDKRLFVLLVLLGQDTRLHEFCLLIPAEAMPEIGYSETITIDPLTKRFAEYRVPSEQVGPVLLKKVFGA